MSSENIWNDMEEKDLWYISASEFSQHLKILTQQSPLESKMIDSWIMPGPSIQEIVDQKCNSSDVSILLDSEIIPRSSWAFLHPLSGTVIQIVGVPKGGGEEGKSPLRIILTIAVMAAAAWIGGSAMALAWFGGSKVVAGLAGMAVAYLGMMAVNAIAPPPKPLDDSSDVKMSASLTGMRNTFNPYGPIPKILGTHRVYPQYASRPYTEILGDDQYLRLLFVVGYGPLDMTDYRIGETPLEDFDDVEMQVMHGYSDDIEQTIYTQTVEENQLSILLEQSGGWYLRTTEADIDEISIDVTIPAGLYTLNSEGRRVSRKVELEIQYAPTSTSDWTVGQSFEAIGAQESPTMKSVTGAGPFYQPVSMYRVVLNSSTGALVLCGPTITTYLSSNYGPPIANSQFPPPVPGWASPIALITIPANATTITNAMITDERTATAPDRENAGDFLPSQDSPLSMNIDVAAGNLRLQFVTEEARSELIRMTKSFQVTNGQYDVRMRRITLDGGDDDVDEVYWTALRSITHEHPIQLDEDLAIIALRIKASDQLNGIVDTFNIIASGIIPDWNGSAWVDRVTNNPASLYREVLQCNANKQALLDARLNLSAIQDWHDDCQPGEIDINNAESAVNKGSGKVGIPVTAHGFVDNRIIYVAGTDNYDGTYEVDTTSTINEIVLIATYVAETFSSSDKIRGQGFEFNLPVDFTMSIEDLLVAIASAGRARPDYLDGQHTIVQDKPQTIPAQHIVPRNSWNFSGQKLFYQMPHAFRVKFKNEEKDYREDEIIVYDDGYNAGNATRFEMLDLPGITTRQLAWKHARFHIAVARLRPETYNVYMDAENLTCTPGDLIHVSHDVTMWGLGWGRVISWTLDGGDATHVTLDDVMPMEVGNSYSIRFRDDDGTTSIHSVVLNVGEQTILEFVTPIDSAEIPTVGSLALFGETNSESIKGIVQSIEPGNDLTALIVFVDEAPAIHTSDTGNIPAFDSQITQPFDVLTSIGAPVIDAIRSNEGVMVKDPGGSIIPRIAISFTYESGKLFDQVSYLEVQYKPSGDVGTWNSQTWPNFQTEIFLDEDIVEGDDYDIRARYKVFDGRWGPWSSIETETVVGRSTPPGTPTSISATAGIGLIRLDWTTPPVIDFDHVQIWKNTEDSFPGGTPNWTVESAAGYPKSMIDEDVNYGTTYYYFFKSADTVPNLSTVSASVNASPNKAGTGDIGDVGGWTVTGDTLYDLTQGTPGSSEEDGIVIDSANQVITTWEDTAKRIMFGKLSAGVYGIRGYATNGTTVIFELSDTQQKIAGWNFTDEALYNLVSGSPGSTENDGIIIDAANKWIRVFENTEKRIQLGYLGVAGIYGIVGYAANGTTKIFEISDTQQMVAGFTFDETEGFYIGSDATRVQMKPGVGIWAGATAIGDAPFSATNAGVIKAISGIVGGWTLLSDYFYSLGGGTPTSNPSDGIVLDSALKAVKIYENTEKRIEIGYLSSGIFGIKGYADNGTTSIFEISDTQIMLAGWDFTATTLASANITIDSGNDRIVVSGITIDGANNRIRSSNYVSGILGAGFTLEPDLLEVGNIRARGMIRTAVFQKDIVSVVGGNLVVLPGDVLNADMTAADNSTLTIEGNETFAVNDILWIKDDTYEEWLQVTNIASAPTYTVTRDKGSDYGTNANPTWKKGASVVHYGNTTSGGTVYMTASETDAPYIQVNTHVGAPWNAQTTRLRMGNLKGFLGEGSEVYGIAIGEATKYLKYDPTGGLQIKGTIIITGGSGIASLTDAGNLVTINEADVDALALTNAPAEAGANTNVGLPSDENLTGYWSMDDGSGLVAIDNSGNGNDGVMTNGEGNEWASGIAGGAYAPDAADEDIAVADDATLNPGTGDFSYSFWIIGPGFGSNGHYPLRKYDAGGTFGYRPEIRSNGTLRALLNSDGTYVDSSSTTNIDDGNKHFIVVTIDHTTNQLQSLYVDGILEDSDDITAIGDVDVAEDFLIGANCSGLIIDEVRFYKGQILNPAEVKALYLYPSGNQYQTSSWEAIAGGNKAADNATVGANWSSNLANIPAELGVPSGSGLYLSDIYVGFYDGSIWKSFIKNDGTIYGGDGADEYFQYVPGSGVAISTAQANAITILAGGDIKLVGTDLNPAKTIYSGADNEVEIFMNTAGDLFRFQPSTNGIVTGTIGSPGSRWHSFVIWSDFSAVLLVDDGDDKIAEIQARVEETFSYSRLWSQWPDNGGSNEAYIKTFTSATDYYNEIQGRVGVGLIPTANMTGLALEGGVLTIKEITTPTADTDYGKVYTKNDNKLYFQDGAGVEHEISLV